MRTRLHGGQGRFWPLALLPLALALVLGVLMQNGRLPNLLLGFRVDLYKGLEGAIEYRYDWDNSASDEADKVDQTLKIRVGYQW